MQKLAIECETRERGEVDAFIAINLTNVRYVSSNSDWLATLTGDRGKCIHVGSESRKHMFKVTIISITSCEQL